MSAEMNKDAFAEILRECGITEDQMTQLHQTMERRFPDSHQKFLELLKVEDPEIRRIRQA